MNYKLSHIFFEFFQEIEKKDIYFSKKKYLYVNIWNILCEPCLEEMPLINKLVRKFDKELVCVMVSQHSDKAVNNFIKEKKIEMGNFIFINNMMAFISEIHNEIEAKERAFPLHVVLDKNGNCLAYLFGSFNDEVSTAPLIDFINGLK